MESYVVSSRGSGIKVTTGQKAKDNITSQGGQVGKIQSSVTKKRRGGGSTKTTFSSVDGSVTKVETKEPFTQEGQTGVRTTTSSRDLGAEAKAQQDYNFIANKVISDLNESNKRDSIKQSQETFNKFSVAERTGTFTPSMAGVISGLERNKREAQGIGKDRLDVEQNVRFSELSGTDLPKDYLYSTPATKQFFSCNKTVFS